MHLYAIGVISKDIDFRAEGLSRAVSLVDLSREETVTLEATSGGAGVLALLQVLQCIPLHPPPS